MPEINMAERAVQVPSSFSLEDAKRALYGIEAILRAKSVILPIRRFSLQQYTPILTSLSEPGYITVNQALIMLNAEEALTDKPMTKDDFQTLANILERPVITVVQEGSEPVLDMNTGIKYEPCNTLRSV